MPALVARKLAFSACCCDDDDEVDAAEVDEGGIDGAGCEAAADRVLRGSATAVAAAADDDDERIAAFALDGADSADDAEADAEVTVRIGRSESRACCAECDEDDEDDCADEDDEDDDCRERCCDDDTDGLRPRAESKASASRPGSSMMRMPRLRASLPSLIPVASVGVDDDEEADEAARRAREDESGRTGLATLAFAAALL